MKTAAALRLISLCAGGLLLAACSGGEDTEPTSSDTDTLDTSDADVQLALELEALIDGYTGWQQLEAWTGIVYSEDGTHGDYVQIWYNDVAFDTVETGGGGGMADGAILVKQGYSDEDGTQKNNLTVMWKNSEYAGSTGWFWANWSSEGVLNAYGEPNGCVSCHASGQDYVTTATW